MGMETFSTEPVLPDESERIDDKEKAEDMAHAGNVSRSSAASMRGDSEFLNQPPSEGRWGGTEALRRVESYADQHELGEGVVHDLQTYKLALSPRELKAIQEIIDRSPKNWRPEEK